MRTGIALAAADLSPAWGELLWAAEQWEPVLAAVCSLPSHKQQFPTDCISQGRVQGSGCCFIFVNRSSASDLMHVHLYTFVFLKEVFFIYHSPNQILAVWVSDLTQQKLRGKRCSSLPAGLCPEPAACQAQSQRQDTRQKHSKRLCKWLCPERKGRRKEGISASSTSDPFAPALPLPCLSAQQQAELW